MKRGKTRFEQHDPTTREVRRLWLERRREKEPLKRKSLSIALCRARQVLRRKQADLRFKKAVEAGAPSRLQGPPLSLRSRRSWDQTDGTTERFTDPLHKETPEWIWQRWPWEVLPSLPTIDSQRVREAAFAFRKRTSCGEDHVVMEMLRELDEDIWETLARCFQFRLLNHWTEDEDMLWARQLVTMVKKKRVPPKCNAPDDVPLFFLRSCSSWWARLCALDVAHSVVTSLVVRLTEVGFILRRMLEQASEWQVPIFVLDCDVAAAFEGSFHFFAWWSIGMSHSVAAQHTPGTLTSW